MTSRLSTRGLGRRLATITAAAMLVLGLGAASAFAAEVSVEPSAGLSATEASTVTVEGSGFEAATKYRIGLCSKETYGIFGIPACGETVEVTADEAGDFSKGVEVEKTTDNAHHGITPPFGLGQPEAFTCAGDPEEDDECEIAVTAHEGSTSTILAREDVSFE